MYLSLHLLIYLPLSILLFPYLSVTYLLLDLLYCITSLPVSPLPHVTSVTVPLLVFPGDCRGDVGAPVLCLRPGLVIVQSAAHHAALQPAVSPAAGRRHLYLADTQGHSDATAVDHRTPARLNDLSSGATRWCVSATVRERGDETDAQCRFRNAGTHAHAPTMLVCSR